ncbi:MAG TPA: hypothetical protein VN650_15105 [Gemmatimonadaceae bacterium]|nr:hypothetical protein [Gemmatimonadaceae bacterium]
MRLDTRVVGSGGLSAPGLSLWNGEREFGERSAVLSDGVGRYPACDWGENDRGWSRPRRIRGWSLVTGIGGREAGRKYRCVFMRRRVLPNGREAGASSGRGEKAEK